LKKIAKRQNRSRRRPPTIAPRFWAVLINPLCSSYCSHRVSL
jgi:hypothetical protein